ncbi:MAG: PfkB family carbohydrate kinase [Acidobacteriota bacterium]|nr:PfkB family carbohydrate kinase [Acidobacteriota bacterium]
MSTKIISTIEEMATRADELRKAGKKLVLCHGTFDLIHIGHIRHLEAARREGDVLFVTLTADAFVSKGPGRPVFNEALRLENMAALACVDYVGLVNDVTGLPAIRAVKPHAYVKGGDYRNAADDLTGNIHLEMQAVKAGGGETVFTDEITFSSTQLLNEHFAVFSAEVKEYLSNFQNRFSADDVLEAVGGLKNLKVCVVGDAIVDEYNYTVPMGQTGKGAVMAARWLERERFAGGALAVANHISGYCERVTLVTGLGRQRSYEDFIRGKLADNIEPVFFYRDDAPTIVKNRFVDGDADKLFEVYYYEDSPPPLEMEQAACQWMARHLSGYDVVIVPDFGNGFISRNMVEHLCAHAPFLAVNTQVNSGNRGFHTINRYRRADFISLNEPELRLAVHDRTGDLGDLAETIAARLGARYIATTLGTAGLFLKDRENDIYRVPALSVKVIDRVGAGDAFLSLAGICLGGGLDAELAALVGSAAAAIDVQIVCNRDSVSPTALFKYLVTLLK